MFPHPSSNRIRGDRKLFRFLLASLYEGSVCLSVRPSSRPCGSLSFTSKMKDNKIHLALSLLNDASMARWALFSYDGRAIRKIELPVLHG